MAIDWASLFFGTEQTTIKVIIGAIAMYLGFVILVRISGKRTLAKMTTFDFVVQIALGALIGVTTLSANAAIIDGLIGLAVIIGLQYLFTWLAVKVPRWRHLIQGSAELIYYKGSYDLDNMRHFRIVERDVLEALRQENIDSLDGVEAVILEDSGKLSVVKKSAYPDKNAMKFVRGLDLQGDSSYSEPA